MERLSSKAVIRRLTENEKWRAIVMLQNGSIQMNVARQFNVSQCDQQTIEPPSADWKCYRLVT